MAQIREHEARSETLRIRCTPSVVKAFKVFKAMGGYKTMEDALKALLEKSTVRYV